MATEVAPGIGTILYVSNAKPATENAAGYEALTWTAVGEVTELPEHGPASEVVTHVPLATGITQKYHGTLNYGSLAVPYAVDRDDAGQVIMNTVMNTKVRASFKVAWADNPGGTSGTVDYYQGKVFSGTRAASSGGANSGSFQVEFETAPVTVAAVV